MKKTMTIDGNTAAAHVAYAFSDVAAITPTSHSANSLNEWAKSGRTNIFGQKVKIVELQSEASAVNAVYGSLKAGAFATTFATPQSLIRMIPKLNKITSENLPGVFHVSAPSSNAQKLSIYDDHSDVMSTLQTGVAMLSSSSVQEIMDLALVAHLSAIYGNTSFVHYFNGSKTIIENKVEELIDYSKIGQLCDLETMSAIRASYFHPGPESQSCEASKKFYDKLPDVVQHYMDEVGKITGRNYKLFDYVGAPDAENVVVVLGCDADFAEETLDYLNAKGSKLGLIKVRLLSPFASDKLIASIPNSCKKIVVMDGSKGQGSLGNPLYLNVVNALAKTEKKDVVVVAGRYGLDSKEVISSPKDVYGNPVIDHPAFIEFIKPVFKFSGDRMVIANSLFKENLDFGLGMLQALEQRREWIATEVLFLAENTVYPDVSAASYDWLNNMERPEISRKTGELLVEMIKDSTVCSTCMNIVSMRDFLTKKSVWIFGGDAATNNTGELECVLKMNRNVNILVMDTEEYCTYGSDKKTVVGPKDLGEIAMSYGNVYVAKVCMGADKDQFIKALNEAEAYDGPSLIIAYSPRINTWESQTHGEKTVDAGFWQMYRYNPALKAKGENPLTLDSKLPEDIIVTSACRGLC